MDLYEKNALVVEKPSNSGHNQIEINFIASNFSNFAHFIACQPTEITLTEIISIDEL